MKRISLLPTVAITVALASLAPLNLRADDYDKKTIVTFDQPTEVPGIVLPPGKYVIKLLNSSSNRHIAEIFNERMDHLYALTFTVAAAKVEQKSKTVMTFYEGPQGRARAIRKWFWPGDTDGQEFVYPKYQASEIGTWSKQKVPEGELPTAKEAGESLSPDNAKGLN